MDIKLDMSFIHGLVTLSLSDNLYKYYSTKNMPVTLTW